ncbi:MAG: 30S ribosomal protein S18 [Ruminococcaceae bacterium]|nr:30S ribosomal protein S18 [Oscillospiraceae bacterium]
MENNQQAQAPAQQSQQKPFRQGNKRHRKVCRFCADKIEHIDYKDISRLEKCTSDRAKILPRRISGTCAMHQRQLTVAIKRARHMALLPYISD